MGNVPFSGRLIFVKINAKRKETVILQVYMHITKNSDEIMTEVYSEIDGAINVINGDVNKDVSDVLYSKSIGHNKHKIPASQKEEVYNESEDFK